jgi:hypothetical protein
MFRALGELNYGKEVAESVLNMAFHFIKDANDEESLLTSIELLLAYSSRYNQLHHAVQSFSTVIFLLEVCKNINAA